MQVCSWMFICYSVRGVHVTGVHVRTPARGRESVHTRCLTLMTAHVVALQVYLIVTITIFMIQLASLAALENVGSPIPCSMP